jgi:hypothetical protein
MSNIFNKYAGKVQNIHTRPLHVQQLLTDAFGSSGYYKLQAQQAINASPLGQYIPPQYQHLAGTGGAQPAQSISAPADGSQAPTQRTDTMPSLPPATTAAPAGVSSGGTSGGGVSDVLRQHGLGSLQNQLRNLQIQYR